MTSKSGALDKTAVARKLMVWMTATALMSISALELNTGLISIVYLGGQSAIDILKESKVINRNDKIEENLLFKHYWYFRSACSHHHCSS